MTMGKSVALTIWNFVGKVMPLLLAFLPQSKRLLISWLQSPSAVIFEPRKNGEAKKNSRSNGDSDRIFPGLKNYVTVSIASPSICHEVMGLNAMILAF